MQGYEVFQRISESLRATGSKLRFREQCPKSYCQLPGERALEAAAG